MKGRCLIRKHQNGFAHAGLLLLIAVVVVLIAASGYEVGKLQSVKHTASANVPPNKSANSGATMAQVTSFAACKLAPGRILQQLQPEVCVTKDGKRFTDTSVQPQLKYLTIKEWDVRAAYSSNYTLTYKIRDGSTPQESYADVTADELVTLDPNCGPESVGVIGRYTSDYVPDPGPDNVGQIYSRDQSGYTKVGNYYYYAEHSHAACSDKQGATNLQGELFNVLGTLNGHFESIPAQ